MLRWFAPPELSEPDLRLCARSLWIVSWPLLGVVAILLSIAVVVEPETLARRTITIAAVAALIGALHMISRAGRPMLASWMLVIGLSVIVTQRAWVTGGIHAPVAAFYVLFIVLAGLLIGTRGGVATAATCVVGAIALTVGTAMGWLTPRPGAGSALGGFVFVMLSISLALVLQALMSIRPRRDTIALDAVQMLVHDMRSPLQTILGHLDLLKDVRGENVKAVDYAIEGATTLDRMATSLLDVSRLEAGQMPVQRSVTNLSAIAHAAVASARVCQPSRDISLEILGDSSCTCDAELTRRILENLVSNAMKHTEIEGKVRVVISSFPSKAALAVHDEGPGIPAHRRTRIFQPFSAEGLRSTTGHASSGLGLAFCKLAAEAQGGSIRVEAGRPCGSVFVVELPR
jgi:signal transduction histidine kinase